MTPAALNAALSGDFENARLASTPGGIERQEAEGQAMLVESALLPKSIRNATREQLEGLGFCFGDDVDELFVRCDLPPGWSKKSTDHSMQSEILDEQGRLRGSIFYKAAFYDRRADMRMHRRFNVQEYYDTFDGHYRCVVTDGDIVAFDAGEWKKQDYQRCTELEIKCNTWLFENFPEWKSPLAYW